MVIGAFRDSVDSARRRLLERPGLVRTGVEIALGLILVVQTARLILIVLDPGAPQTLAARVAPPPADLTIFQRFDPFSRGLSGGGEAPAVSGGGYRLFGLRQGGPGGGSAIIGLSDGRQVSVGVGEEVEPGVILKAVLPDSVVLSRGGADETLAFAEVPVSAPVSVSAPAEEDPVVAAPPIQPTAAVAPEVRLIDPARLMAQASLRPRLQGVQIRGLTVSARGDGAALRASGLQSGDVILAVNDTELNGVQSLAALRGGLASAPTARIRFERNGREQTVTVRTAP